MDKLIKEVGDMGDRMMIGAPYTAGGGVINTGYPTPTSPDNSQKPESFKYTPSLNGSQTNIDVKVPDKTDELPNIAKQPENVIDTEKGIKAIKFKVTPDEVICGINAELENAVFKRPDVAKAEVIKNLKRDSKYYSKLKFLGIDDTVNEEFKGKTSQEIAIAKIMRELFEKKKNKR